MAHKIRLADDSSLMRRTLRGLIDQNLDRQVLWRGKQWAYRHRDGQEVKTYLVILDSFISENERS
jgi:hypothetical protein